ncbi:MAG: SH3 domain-containing protein [Spirochaetota bacterium]
MRRISIAWVVALLTVGVVFWSCEPTEGGAQDTAGAEDGIPAVVLFEGALFVEGDVDAESGRLTESGTDTLDLGEAVRYLGESATWEYQGSDLEMLKIVRDDDTVGYAWSDFVATNAVPGVITAETRIFSEGQDAGVTTRMLPPVQLVAVFDEEFKDDLLQVSFTPLEPTDTYGRNRIYTVYVKRNDITTEANDVKVAYLYYLATRTDDVDSKIARLEVALETQSVFSPLMQSNLDKLRGEGDQTAAAAPEQVSGGIPEDFEITDDVQGTEAALNTRSNVRSRPSRDSESVSILEAGTFVTVDFRTVETETIRGLTDSWYMVTIPAEDGTSYQGWIFGALLDEVE